MNWHARRSIAAVGCVLAIAAAIIPATAAQAASRSWTGTSGALWSTAANWSGGAIAAGDDLVFPAGVTQKAVTNDTPAGTSYSTLAIGDPGYTLTGNALALTGGISTSYASGSATNAIPTSVAGPITVASGGTLVQSGAISGAQTLTKAGGGTLELDSAANTYTGSTTITSGVLQADGNIPTPVVLGGGTLSGSGTLQGAGLTSTSASTVDPGTVGGSGVLSYSASAGLSLPNATTFHVDLNSPTVGAGYDQLKLTSGSALFNPNGANLDIALGYLPALNTSYQIVSQAFGSPITGRFNGISQFGSVVSGPVVFSVGYFNSGVIITVTAVNPTTSTWDGGGTTANWSEAANWVGDAVPPRFANLVFPAGAQRLTNVNDLPAGFDVSSISVAAGYQLGGANSLDLGGTVTASGNSTISLPLNLTATRQFDVASGASLAIDGPLSGPGSGITKTGAGTVRINSSAVVTYTGATIVSAGILSVGGSIASSSSVAVSGGTLAGFGTVPAVSATSGQVAPTLLTTGSLALAAGSQYSAALNGTNPGLGYSQSDVTGTVNVTGSTLATTIGFTPTYGTAFTIVNNDGTDAVTGTFSGLAEGATFTSGSRLLRISYVGGTGNDIVLAVDQNAPVAAADAYTATEDTPLVVAAPGVLGNDSDIEGDTLSAVLVSGPANGTLTLNATGSFTYTPAVDYVGSDSFTYRASDGIASSNTVTVTLTVDGVNDAPVAAADAYTATEDTPLAVAAPGVLANDSDIEGSALSAVLVTGPAHGTLALNADGSFTYTPTADYNGVDSFSYRSSDGTASSAAVTVTLTIAAVADAPVGIADSASTTAGASLLAAAPGVLANDTDADGDPLTAVLVTATNHGTLTLNSNGSYAYTPEAGYTGTDVFSYRSSDGSLLSAITTVTITVRAAPVQAVALAATGIELAGPLLMSAIMLALGAVIVAIRRRRLA